MEYDDSLNEKIFPLLKQSYDHLLQNNINLNSDDLEAEVINFVSYIYLKDSIDFSLNYLDQKKLKELNGLNFNICDRIIDCCTVLFAQNYSQGYAQNAKNAVRMNIRLADNYDSFLKSYFISKHKIVTPVNYNTFYSSRNSLWSNNGSKILDSPTQREVNYALDFESNTFEVLINPFNPLVKGYLIPNENVPLLARIAGIRKIVTGVSTDNTRQFTWYFKSTGLYEIIMNRFDKGDAIKYHL